MSFNYFLYGKSIIGPVTYSAQKKRFSDEMYCNVHNVSIILYCNAYKYISVL